jgi:hypothetical protein
VSVLGLEQMETGPLRARERVWFRCREDSIPGLRRCYVTDPWGNPIEPVAASA